MHTHFSLFLDQPQDILFPTFISTLVDAVNPTMIGLNGTASVQDYIDVLSSVTYTSLADEPGYSQRIVLFELVDDRDYSFTATAFVNIIPTNDPTLFSFNSRVVIFNESARVPINLIQSSDYLVDPDGNSLSWLSVEIRPSIDEMDVLFADTANTNLEVEISSNLLTITGYADFTVYEAVLQTLTFHNPSLGISLSNRTIQLVTYNGQTESPPTPITVVIDGFDDTPLCFFNHMVSPSYNILDGNYYFHPLFRR